MKVGDIVVSVCDYNDKENEYGIVVGESADAYGMILVESFTIYWSGGTITSEQDFEVKLINVH
jgi:hypothetical protein